MLFSYVAKKVFGTRNDRVLKSIKPLVFEIGSLESRYQAQSEQELKGHTALFKQRIAQGEPLDSLLPEAFAVVREAARRVLGMRHFDVQLIGGTVLHRGMIAEMKTGEGKTLVATLPAYLNALSGKGVHVVTVNDYLAKRDAEWMGRLYNYLGLSVGVVVPGIDEQQRKQAYQSDITYGQNNEFGFDYLRDNMKFTLEDMAQRGHNFAIVDEVDSILIDEARTPLIISGPAEESTDKYYVVNKVIPALMKDLHFEMDVKTKQPSLTEDGVTRIEELLGLDNLYEPQNADLVHHVNQALRAHNTMQRDVDYVVRDGQVIIVDEFTGRLMTGRRWSDGLHQAVEAKEGLKIARENQTLATITFQNYFRLYSKLSGMTGTADTEAVEFKKIYNLEVTVVPTNRPMLRDDRSDLVYKTRKEKYQAVEQEISECHQNKQPVLVGTISIEQSEELSSYLQSKGVPHNVLNAKQHEREAEIVAQAGRLGAVTISTNMAGRGTDIVLGGNPEFMAAKESGTRDHSDPAFIAALEKYSVQCKAEREEVLKVGGLHILGTERHESRRIDNQLRGRSGRQGDPGSSRFYIALEDDLMKRFGGEKLLSIMSHMGMEEGQSLEGGMMSRAIENAQRRVEAYNFDIRKHLLEYDDVMNKQRNVIYSERYRVLSRDKVRERVLEMSDDLIEEIVLSVCDQNKRAVEWDLDLLSKRFAFLVSQDFTVKKDELELDVQAIFDRLRAKARELYESQVSSIGDEQFSNLEQHIFLQSLDRFWKEHLLEMDHLKDGIGLRGYGQKNPLHEYQREGFGLFQSMLNNVKEDIVRKLYGVRILSEEEVAALEAAEEQRREAQAKQISMVHSSVQAVGTPATGADQASGSAAKGANKDPELERERLRQAKKARRKR